MESSPIAPTAGMQQLPSQFLESLSLWVHPDSRLLICFDENCRHAISPLGSHPTDHLRDKHKIPLSQRKGLSKVLATLNLKNPEQAAPLVDGSPEDKRLRSYDGFSCLHCKYRTINLVLIMRHYSQDLPEYPQHPRKPTRRADIETYFEYVYLQAWASGSSRAYWIVERDGRLVRPVVPAGNIHGLVSSGRNGTGNEQQDFISSVQAREHQRNHRLVDGPRLEGNTQATAAGSATTYAEQRPWLERTRWETTYKNKDRSLLRCLIQIPYLQLYGRPEAPPYLLASAARVSGLSIDLVSPREDEIRIGKILKIVDVVMERCEETVHGTSRSLLCWLKSNHPHVPYPKPFTLVKHASSTTRYRLLLKKALAFCFRAYRMDAKQRERLVGVRFNTKLDSFLNAIWHHEDLENSPQTAPISYPIEDGARGQQQAEEAGEDEMRIEPEDMDVDESVYEDSGKADDDSEEEDDGSDLYSGSDDDDGDDSAGILGPSYDKNEEGDSTSGPEHGSSLATLAELVFGLSLALCTERLTDGQPSSTVLVYFSGILAFSEITNSFLNARAYTPYLSGFIYIQRLLFLERALPLRPYDYLGIERRPRFKQLGRFKQVHRRYMVMGSQSSFEEFVSLRAYGCVAARNDMPSFLLYWSDDGQRVGWGQGVEISMGQFRSLTEYLIKEVNGLCNSLMFGLEPDIDLSQIKDDMANNDSGYSFVTDPKNKLTSAYLDLLKHACTARHGCLSRGNCWNWSEVDRYRKKEEDFRELLGPAMSLTGGQQPRWPELSSLWVENDELGPRGLYVYKGYFIYVVRHHKAKSSTNREFVVVRFLPAELALAVFKYCTYIRPFINLLDRERGVNSLAIASQSSSPLLFRTQSLLSNSKPWHTSRFTNMLRKVTFKVWGLAVNSRLLRQICIGITEKHVREVFQPFNRFDDRSKDAHRNVVFAWQSGHRPLQRGFTYGLDGAFPTTMQPQLLDLYEWASLRWHEFLHLPSRLRPRMNAQIQSDRERILGHQPNVTAEGMGEIAERLISETQLTPDRKRADAESRGHEQKSPSPGDVSWIPSSAAKRRRVRHVAMSPVDEISPSLTESEAPGLFGNLHEPCSHDDIKERRAVIQFLHKYSSARSEKWRLQDRLTRVYETLEWWEFVGCQLCFVAKGGQPEPDHTVESCFQSAGNEKARQILRWLESLPITCYEKNGRRGCSVCAPFMPCREVVYADAVLRAKSPETKRYMKEQLESKPGPDGHCEKKPIIRSVIAALCAYDNQFLGKILLKFGQDGDGKNLNDDQDARSWFEADIHLDDFTFPRLFMAFELVVLSFYFRANQSRELAELAGFPEKAPVGLISTSHSNQEESNGLLLQDECPPWDNAEEVAAWKESVEWWRGKCSFCAGRGLGGALMEHTLQQCKRGGASKLKSELGMAMYLDGIVPSNGCDVCLRPFGFCSRWHQNDDGNFTRREVSKARRKCERYRFLLADIAIGLFHCGKGKFKMEMLDDAEEYCEQHESGTNNLDEETVACSLAQHLTVVGIRGSVLIRRVNSWTREIRQNVR